jgi:hypothetical protein
MRVLSFFIVFLLLAACISCKHRELSQPVIVHVLRDPSASFAKRLRDADLQFALTKPHLNNRMEVLVTTNEGSSFPKLQQRLADTPQDLLILSSQSDLPEDAGVRDRLGKPQLICGVATAYIPDWVSGEEREATEMYLRFLEAHCDGNASSL